MAVRRPEALASEILAARGITSPEAVQEFLSEKPARTHDPFLLPDMEAGVSRILAALKDGQNICIYGDYDVDGILAAVLLVTFLRGLPGAVPAHVHWYVPSRFDEGYGLNREALQAIREGGAQLVVSVDCGSVSREEVSFAQSIGLDMVVTDHHECAEGLMPECPFIDPKRADSRYPYTGICGCGVAFKLVQALVRRACAGGEVDAVRGRTLQNSLLDLVAIATVADVVPLTDENRTFVKYGLAQINDGKRPALRKLCEAIGAKPGTLRSYNIAFGIAPHLNAAGRMGDAGTAIELFLTDDEARMDEIIAELVSRNVERRRVQDEAFAACATLAEGRFAGDSFLLVRPPEVHEGVAGIVAGKLKDAYGLPAAVLSETRTEDGKTALKGSARSVEGFDLISALRRHAALFWKLGGHAMAAGFTLPEAGEDALRAALNDEVRTAAEVDPGILQSGLRPDMRVLPEEATLDTALMLERFEPCGTENRTPILALDGVLVREVRRMGADGKHLRFSATLAKASDPLDSRDQSGVSCVMFAKGNKAADLPQGSHPITLIGTLEVNRWHGRESAQFIVREARTQVNDQ
ncbi:MAG: single-stranded-DNA-specific exonuclease RecJ, partial [Clostridiales Family XIII bacterium]|nr:single-stranded-DNA-specific exonuclease RecJ [Clostridiales Family XIII bacterium]